MTVATKPDLAAVAPASAFGIGDRVHHLNFGAGGVTSVVGQIDSASDAGWLVTVTWDDHGTTTHVATSHLTAAHRCTDLSAIAQMVFEAEQDDLRQAQTLAVVAASKALLAEVKAGRVDEPFLDRVDAHLEEEDMLRADLLRVHLGQRMIPVDMTAWRLRNG